MEEKEYLTEAETCIYLGVSRGTLYNYVKRELLKKYTQKIPRQVLCKKSELGARKTNEPRQ